MRRRVTAREVEGGRDAGEQAGELGAQEVPGRWSTSEITWRQRGGGGGGVQHGMVGVLEVLAGEGFEDKPTAQQHPGVPMRWGE